MFDKKAAVFFYAISPVHMGAGQAIGVIDNPIQRERHTRHPSFAGSGIKGAVRHGFKGLGGAESDLSALFGPVAQSSQLHAGAVSFSDAQLVALPIRSAREGYVYATCPQAIARASRLLGLMGHTLNWPVFNLEQGQCLLTNNDLFSDHDQKIHLESFEYNARMHVPLRSVAEQFADMVFPTETREANAYFHQKMIRDLVVLTDSDFDYFSSHATLVEAHVRIDDETGAASDGGLFYTENLPPESVMISSLMVSQSRTGQKEELPAEAVMQRIKTVIHGKLLQLGGDASTGRGLMLTSVVGG